MKFTDLFIRRPVLAMVVSLLILVIGLRAALSIPIRQYPRTENAVVTVTTVGYGDISPKTVLGRLLASLLMIIGYGIIAVPTGIVTLEFTRGMGAGKIGGRSCSQCGLAQHDKYALYCKRCGQWLEQS